MSCLAPSSVNHTERSTFELLNEFESKILFNNRRAVVWARFRKIGRVGGFEQTEF